MAKQKKQNEDTVPPLVPTKRYYVSVVAFVVFGVSLGALLMLEAYPYLEVRHTLPVEEQITIDSGEVTTTPSDTSYALPREFPVHIRIPKISVDAAFGEPLGLNADQSISVPKVFDTVGWYKLGAAPGEIGTAAILGHVDSYKGPAVFYSLGQLAPGDEIYITRADGSEATFVVEYYERYPQDEFPAEKVYTPTSYASLRLITCSGIYKKGEQRYTHNLVVYARLKEPAVSAE